MKNKCEKPCATCPFLKENHGKPNPHGFDPPAATAKSSTHNFYDWFSRKNLERVWRGMISNAEPLICHSNDPQASTYGGVDSKREPKICLGSAIAIFLHIKYYENLLKSEFQGKQLKEQYQAQSEIPMPKKGMGAWAVMFAFGRTDLIGGFSRPGTPRPARSRTGRPRSGRTRR